ncbi:uncharacterized protein LOC128165182 [Crassostrea angulata]|uniref:uncharacterized protein LOC128165182 n=1 Tax=Magallana angulata TaxID=2784310 RepID=UPI0022B1AAD8|nr:uncharacterized protein LOC128165182 [Crassostrea angulata]
MEFKTLAFCVIIFLVGEIAASSHLECPDTVPATGSNGSLPTCTDDTQCSTAGDKCCTVTSGGSGKVCIKAERDDDDDDCDKKSNRKDKDDCHRKKRHSMIVKIVILVVVLTVVGIVVGCIIRVKCCKKKISDSRTELNPEKNTHSLGRDYTPSIGGRTKEQAWFPVASPPPISNAPPEYTAKY